jgi:hypothetical protein
MDKVFKNMDLVRLIYSFGYPEHRMHMKGITSCFKQKDEIIQFNLSCLQEDWIIYHEIYPDGSMDRMISSLFVEEEQYNLLHQLIDCRCCTRHSYGKPIRSMLWASDYVPARDESCLCCCRHMSRVLLHSIYHNNNRGTCRIRADRYKNIGDDSWGHYDRTFHWFSYD